MVSPNNPADGLPCEAAWAKDDLDIDTMITNARKAAEFLKALSHEARLVILCLLVEGEKSVTEIEQLVSLRQPAVSQQLARLRADKLVETRRNGKSVYYSLARPEVRDSSSRCTRHFARLHARVEADQFSSGGMT